MTSPRRAVLRNRAALLGALAFCIYAALPESVTSLRSVSRSAPYERNPILIFGLMASTFIAVSIASRSPFLGDRLVFGPAAGAFVLWLVRAVVPLGPLTTSVMNGLVSLMWAIGAVAALLALIFVSRRAGG